MWSLFRKKGKAAKEWRSRAWLIDPKKTRITFFVTLESALSETAEYVASETRAPCPRVPLLDYVTYCYDLLEATPGGPSSGR